MNNLKQTVIWTVLPRGKNPANGKLCFSLLASLRLEHTHSQALTLAAFTSAREWPSYLAGIPLKLRFLSKLKPGNSELPGTIHIPVEALMEVPPLQATEVTCSELEGGIRCSTESRLSIWRKVFPMNEVLVDAHDFGNHIRKMDSVSFASFPGFDLNDFVDDYYNRVCRSIPELPVEESLAQPAGTLELGLARRVQKHLVECSEVLTKVELRNGASLLDNSTPILAKAETAIAPGQRRSSAFAAAHDFCASQFTNKTAKLPPEIKPFDFHDMVTSYLEHPDLLRALGLVMDIEVFMPEEFKVLTGTICYVCLDTESLAADTEGAEAIRHVPCATKCVLSAQKGALSFSEDQQTAHEGLQDISNKTFTLAQGDLNGSVIKLGSYAQKLKATGESLTPPPSRSSGGISLLQEGRAHALGKRLTRARTLQQGLESFKALCVAEYLHAEDLQRGFRVDVLEEAPDAVWQSLCWRKEDYLLGFANDPTRKNLSLVREGTLKQSSVVQKGKTKEDQDIHDVHEALVQWSGWSLAAPRPGALLRTPADVRSNGKYVEDPQTDSSGRVTVRLQASKESPRLPKLRFGRKYRLRLRTVDLAGNCHKKAGEDNSLQGATGKALQYGRYEPIPSPVLVRMDAPLPGESTDRLIVRESEDTARNVASCRRLVCPPRSSFETAERHGCFDIPPPEEDKSWFAVLDGRHGKDAQLGTNEAGHNAPEAPTWSYPEKNDIPYLPDPQTTQALLRLMDGERLVSELKVNFDDGRQWPHARPFVLTLKSGEKEALAAEPDQDGHPGVTVTLPVGETRVLRLSSIPKDLSVMKLWQQLAEEAPEKQSSALRQIMENGRHWMISPSRDVVLVNASQKPRFAPDLLKITPSRTRGSDTAVLGTLFTVHSPSTGHLELNAHWSVLEDATGSALAGQDGPTSAFHTGRQLAASMTVPSRTPRETGTFFAHQLPDKRRYSVNYSLNAVSRHQEYFVDVVGDNAEQLSFSRNDGANLGIHIPSSLPPAIPEIAYLMPLFDWEKPKDLNGLRVRRRGGQALRVYLKAPWFSSGEGELLAVVMAARNQEHSGLGLPAVLHPLCTQWAKDPLFPGQAPSSLPSLHDFKEATVKAAGLSLQELKETPDGWSIAAAAHEVSYDKDRKLWFTDIAIDPGQSYYPFLRLALARYQPVSVARCELSPVVLADFIQLAPERSLSIVMPSGDSDSLKVFLSGISPSDVKGTKKHLNQVAFRLEQFAPAFEDWLPVGEEVRLIQPTHTAPSSTVWAGALDLPTARKQGQFRLVISEYELHPAHTQARHAPSARELKRLVYQDILNLPITPALAPVA